jgi:hypothetical protein
MRKLIHPTHLLIIDVRDENILILQAIRCLLKNYGRKNEEELDVRKKRYTT